MTIGLKQLHSRLCAIEILISASSQQADDQCLVRENLECARLAVGYLLRDLEHYGIPA